jgi:disulfide bond formation protein DsbB
MESRAPTQTGVIERRTWAWLALLVSLLGTFGSFYLSIGMGLKACPLCFYERTLIMAILGVLGVGMFVDRSCAGFTCLLCVPLAFAGLGVAIFHEYLVLSGTLECPKGVFSLGTAPLQSLATYIVLTACILVGSMKHVAAMGASALLGFAFAWGCVAGSPPMPPAPAKPYDQPLEVCRPPFRDDH